MSKLVPKRGEYKCAVQLLVQAVPVFAKSQEYKSLGNCDLELPGVVFGAFARFLTRLQRSAIQGKSSGEELESLAASYQAIEQFSSSNDPDMVNAVVVEIFENLDCEPPILETIKAHLGKASQQLYKKWID
jgi:hypothetical protein